MSLASLQARLAQPDPSFSPFFVLGDPDPDTSLAIAQAAIRGGADMLEFGLPFSDPCADGPSVQTACSRALRAGMTVDQAFEIMRTLRSASDVPFNLLVYANLVHRRGPASFVADAVAAGASSLLVPDVPPEEGTELGAACHHAGLGLVHLAGPRTTTDRITALGDAATAFLYLAGRQGITGASEAVPDETLHAIRTAAAASTVPVCVGFGLKTRRHLADVFRAGARIAIVGSALVDVLASCLDDAGSPRDVTALTDRIEQEVADRSRWSGTQGV
ncbi:MAG: tryptophan synthase subunit alpha [Planctomycetes bacterium]|nr:tryptophan synthase subunit alpha [Planctomycetota bacterium]